MSGQRFEAVCACFSCLYLCIFRNIQFLDVFNAYIFRYFDFIECNLNWNVHFELYIIIIECYLVGYGFDCSVDALMKSNRIRIMSQMLK